MRRLFYSERLRQIDLIAKEATGQTFWSPDLKIETRNKIIYAVNNLCNNPFSVKNRIRYTLISNYGKAFLQDPNLEGYIDYDLSLQKGDVNRVLDMIEATYFELEQSSIVNVGEAIYGAQRKFEVAINEIFQLDRNSYIFREGQIHKLSEQFSFENIIFPTMNLLNLKSDFLEVNNKFKEALEEIARNKPADAITDAGTTLQIYLNIKGFPGKVLSEQINVFKQSKVVSGVDLRLLNALIDCMNWISGIRNQKGDAHPGENVQLEDAWFVLRILGALILRFESL